MLQRNQFGTKVAGSVGIKKMVHQLHLYLFKPGNALKSHTNNLSKTTFYIKLVTNAASNSDYFKRTFHFYLLKTTFFSWFDNLWWSFLGERLIFCINELKTLKAYWTKWQIVWRSHSLCTFVSYWENKSNV